MPYEQLGHCPRCGVLPYMKAVAGQFFWGCDCPPPQTYTNNNTSEHLRAEAICDAIRLLDTNGYRVMFKE